MPSRFCRVVATSYDLFKVFFIAMSAICIHVSVFARPISECAHVLIPLFRSTFMRAFPSEPDLVVIRITPFEPREP